jgi:hypothetical protein
MECFMNRRSDDDKQFDDPLESLRRSLPTPTDSELQGIADVAKQKPRSIARQRTAPRWSRPALASAAIITLLVGSALGFGLASALTPSGTAAGNPIGLGFLPEPGWDVLQTGADTTRDQRVIAMASNRAFAPDDTARNLRYSSGLPYATLLALPKNGIVIVVSFTTTDRLTTPSDLFPARDLPLSLREASPSAGVGAQVRPERPLGQYLLRAAMDGYNVELQIYFGTLRPSPEMIEAAQRQVDRLSVNARTTSRAVHSRALPLRTSSVRATTASRILDRTFVCSTTYVGGAYSIEGRGHSGTGRAAGAWARPPLAAVKTGAGANGGPRDPSILDNSLVWITAGRPSAAATLVEGSVLSDLYRTRLWGTLAVNTDLCRNAKKQIQLASRGLRGGTLGSFEESSKCLTPRRVVMRVRAVLSSPAVLRRFRDFGRTTVPVREATFVIQTEAGRRLVYGEVSESGRARLLTARDCFPS